MLEPPMEQRDTEPQPVALVPAEPVRSLGDLWAETGVVLLICVAPHILNSTLTWSAGSETGRRAYIDFVLQIILGSLGAISLVLYLIRRSNEPWERFGIVSFEVRRDLLGGVGLFILGMVGNVLLWFLLTLAFGRLRVATLAAHDTSHLPIPDRGGLALLAIMSLFNGFAEELVMRAFLIPRFRQLFGSSLLALLISSMLFCSYHSYQGSGGIISSLGFGLIYGLFFCWTGRLWPLVLGHAIQDMLGLAMLK